MEERSPLKDVTTDNITSSSENGDKKITDASRRVRMSLMKAFDPLYESPYKTSRKHQEAACSTFKACVNGDICSSRSDENSDPMSSELVDLTDATQSDSFDVRENIDSPISEAINTALNTTFDDTIIEPLLDETLVNIQEKSELTLQSKNTFEVDKVQPPKSANGHQTSELRSDSTENIPDSQTRANEQRLNLESLVTVNANGHQQSHCARLTQIIRQLEMQCKKQAEHIETQEDFKEDLKCDNANKDTESKL